MMFKTVVLCVSVVLVQGTLHCANLPVDVYRLSRTITPSFYSIKIRPDFENGRFHGNVAIHFHTTNNENEICLHSSELQIEKVYLNGRNATLRELPERDIISISYGNEKIQPGEHLLYFKYKGELGEKSYGFIKAPYSYLSNETFVYVTDLEPNYARKVFPCFDEPYFKANFKLRLISPNNTYRAISNMPQINKFSSSRGTIYDFDISPKMSTYLVSFVFTPYSYFEDEFNYNEQKYTIRIFSLDASKENSEFAMNCTKTALKFYSDYTNISYLLPKLDMIEYERNETAATENWGLITFRKGLLTPSLGIFFKSQIELVIHHEISHFWFGNLVTNDWWNDLWLQEGFANYMSYKLSAKTEGVSQVANMKSFSYDYFLDFEVRIDSLPIVSYMPKEDDIVKKFTNLVYDKGAALLLMLETVVGEERFHKTIQRFLQKFSFKTATTHDFITVLEEIVPEMPVRAFVEGYVYQRKFPLILVDRNEKGTFLFKQKVCGTPYYMTKTEMKWTVPIVYVAHNKTYKSSNKIVWFDKDMDVLEIEEETADWILVNPDGIGMYKVVLSDTMQKATVEIFQNLDQQTTANVISNSVYLFKNNFTSCDFIIQLMDVTTDSKKWKNFTEFYHQMLKNLLCQQYDNEAELFVQFVARKFNETNYDKKLNTKLPSNLYCGDAGPEEFPEVNMTHCVNWIKSNLNMNEQNVVK